MTSTVVVFLVVASIFSIGDWWAVQVAKKSFEYVFRKRGESLLWSSVYWAMYF